MLTINESDYDSSLQRNSDEFPAVVYLYKNAG